MLKYKWTGCTEWIKKDGNAYKIVDRRPEEILFDRERERDWFLDMHTEGNETGCKDFI
jgi:hypothetical protein